jgi:hypothetical protein
MIFHQTKNLLVTWDDSIRCSVLQLNRYVEGEEFRKAADSALRLLERKSACKLLTNSLEMKALPQEDQLWVDEDWRPRATAAGLLYNAVVIPKSPIAQLTVDTMMKRVPVGVIEFAYFSDIEEAKSWLRSK